MLAALADRVDPAAPRRAFAIFVVAMTSAILVREAEAWLPRVRTALPQSIPQLVFVLVVLGIGIAAGRVSLCARGPAHRAVLLRGRGDIMETLNEGDS